MSASRIVITLVRFQVTKDAGDCSSNHLSTHSSHRSFTFASATRPGISGISSAPQVFCVPDSAPTVKVLHTRLSIML